MVYFDLQILVVITVVICMKLLKLTNTEFSHVYIIIPIFSMLHHFLKKKLSWLYGFDCFKWINLQSFVVFQCLFFVIHFQTNHNLNYTISSYLTIIKSISTSNREYIQKSFLQIKLFKSHPYFCTISAYFNYFYYRKLYFNMKTAVLKAHICTSK